MSDSEKLICEFIEGESLDNFLLKADLDEGI